MEIWKDIKDYEGKYQVSSLGRIRSLTRKVNKTHGQRTVVGKVKAVHAEPRGYAMVSLYCNGKGKRHHVHRLVAEAFVPANGKPFVNHIDGDKLNNNAQNLEWVTNQENQIHALQMGLNKNIGANNYKARSVIQLTMDRKNIRVWSCMNDAAKELGIAQANIVACCNNRRNHAGGYMWRYENEVKNNER